MDKMMLVQCGENGTDRDLLESIVNQNTIDQQLIRFDYGGVYCIVERLHYNTDHMKIIKSLKSNNMTVWLVLEPDKQSGRDEVLYVSDLVVDGADAWNRYNSAVENIHTQRQAAE